MKRIATALVLGSLIAATATVAAESTFPQGADGEPQGLPALSTYADRHTGEPAQALVSSFPRVGNPAFPNTDWAYALPAQSTHADRHANDPVSIVGSPFPEGADDSAD